MCAGLIPVNFCLQTFTFFLGNHDCSKYRIYGWKIRKKSIRDGEYRPNETSSPVTLLTQDVIKTSIQRSFNVLDVRWMLKQCRVLTGES